MMSAPRTGPETVAQTAEERHQHHGQVKQRVKAGGRLDLGEVEEPDRAD
jgi:hypothetical protein